MFTIHTFAIAALAASALFATSVTRSLRGVSLTSIREHATSGSNSATVRRYGGSAKVGNGRVRSYVLVDRRSGAPSEIGVALDERALEGLPATGAGHHTGTPGPMHQWILPLPETPAVPFRFLELNWNPEGHEPDGVYAGAPHFDFHFYTVSKATRDSIMPDNPRFAELANALPDSDYVPAFNAQLGPPGSKPADVAVPLMGVHWIDLRSPELQGLLGKPEAYRPFTRTFIHGTWDGRVHFWEPMITRAHLLEKKGATDASVRDERIALPLPRKYQQPGYYPTAYRITWDAKAREYRVALTELARRG